MINTSWCGADEDAQRNDSACELQGTTTQGSEQDIADRLNVNSTES